MKFEEKVWHSGLGCDNIVGAKFVNWKGEVVEADVGLLKGVRGAGDAFGPIIEMTVKNHSLKRKFNEGYKALVADGIPPALSIQQLVMNSPMGKVFGAAFIWGSDDHETGQIYVAKTASLGNVVMNTVAPNIVSGFTQSLATVVPANVYGSIDTISIRKYTPEAVAIMARNCAKMPATSGSALSIHELRGASAAPRAESVFGSREPHLMLEIIKTVIQEADLKEAEEWTEALMAELRKMDPENIFPGTYVSLTPPGSNSSANIFGSS